MHQYYMSYVKINFQWTTKVLYTEYTTQNNYVDGNSATVSLTYKAIEKTTMVIRELDEIIDTYIGKKY